ncbi:MAG TPA: phosphotransferase [Candidatus Paceibacterota bacterium]|nr:phosphotransferase [Candidatus Paceibacterota bacterium]
MNFGGSTAEQRRQEFLRAAGWNDCSCDSLTGDASARRYFRVRRGSESAILMDASLNLESVAPFIQLDEHLCRLGFRAPKILARDPESGFLLLEDFGDSTFARLLDEGHDAEQLYRLATDVLIALHSKANAIPAGLRAYHPEKMLEDIELFLDWRTPGISDLGRVGFRTAWREVLPLAHRVPSTLLLRDYHVANLMLIPGATGIAQVGLLDFQDAYKGPVTYDLVSLLEDARRDLPAGLEEKLMAHYLSHFPGFDQTEFEISRAILAAQRHTRVLAIFERLSRRDGKHDYKRLHSPRVERRLQNALQHPILAGVKDWMNRHAR